MSDPMHDTIKRYMKFIAGCFLLLSLYLVYIVVVRGEGFAASSANPGPLWSRAG